MMRPMSLTITPANVNLAGIAALQTTGGAANLTLAAGASTLANPVKVAITSTGDISARTFTVTGTDSNGNAITDAITGPNNTTVYGAKYFANITQIAVDGAVGTNTKVGFDGTGSSGTLLSKVLPLDFYSKIAPEVAVEVTGTINYTVNQTFDPIIANGTANMVTQAISNLTSKTAMVVSQTAVGATGINILVNTYSNGATLTVRVIHSRDIA